MKSRFLKNRCIVFQLSQTLWMPRRPYCSAKTVNGNIRIKSRKTSNRARCCGWNGYKTNLTKPSRANCHLQCAFFFLKIITINLPSYLWLLTLMKTAKCVCCCGWIHLTIGGINQPLRSWWIENVWFCSNREKEREIRHVEIMLSHLISHLFRAKCVWTQLFVTVAQ